MGVEYLRMCQLKYPTPILTFPLKGGKGLICSKQSEPRR